MTTASPPPSTEDQHDECVLCCYPFPFKPEESGYSACCGELICDGCIVAQQRTLIIGTNVKKPIKGSKEEEEEFMLTLCSKLRKFRTGDQLPILCPFCRAKKPKNSKERLKRLWERIDVHKDPKAMLLLGSYYLTGECGLTENLKKTKELYQQAYDVGDDIAAFNLSLQASDKASMVKYLEEGAQRGHVECMGTLANIAYKSGNYEAAARQYMIAARSGHVGAMGSLMATYREDSGNLVPKDDLATTLRAHKTIHDAGKSEPREYAMRYEVFRAKMITTRPRNAIGNVVLL